MQGHSPVRRRLPLAGAKQNGKHALVDAGQGRAGPLDDRSGPPRVAAEPWRANADPARLVLELVDAQLPHETAQGAGGIVAGGDQHGAMMQANIRGRI